MKSMEDFSQWPKWDTNEYTSYRRQNSIVRMYNNDAIHDGKEILPLFSSESTRINDETEHKIDSTLPLGVLVSSKGLPFG